MTECEELIDGLHEAARNQVHLAVLAQATPVAAMHLDLARLNEDRAQAVEQVCDQGLEHHMIAVGDLRRNYFAGDSRTF